MSARRAVLDALAAALLAGCAGAGPVKPGEPARAAEHYRVSPQIEWSRIERGAVDIWTVDGPQLQQLRFYRAVADGDTLFRASRRGTRIGYPATATGCGPTT